MTNTSDTSKTQRLLETVKMRILRKISRKHSEREQVNQKQENILESICRKNDRRYNRENIKFEEGK